MIVLQIDENVAREIINHRSLKHPNIIRFKEASFVNWFFLVTNELSWDLSLNWLQVILTPTHLAIVMEYASGGELFERICTAGRFSEAEVSLSSLFFDNFLKFSICGFKFF